MRDDQPKVLNIAHRGARSLAPENTLSAARKAFEIGADMWELDVAVTADGVPYVVHDDTLARTSNVAEVFPSKYPWYSHTFSLAEIQQLDFGSWFVKADPFGQIAAGVVTAEEQRSYRGERAPTLREALEFTREHNWRVNVEIKNARSTPFDNTIAEQVMAEIEALDMIDRVLLSSFNHCYIEQAKGITPKIETAALVAEPVDDPIMLLRQLHAQAFHPNPASIHLETISALRDQDIPVNVWTVNYEGLMAMLIDAGVSGIITDFPQLLSKILADADQA